MTVTNNFNSVEQTLEYLKYLKNLSFDLKNELAWKISDATDKILEIIEATKTQNQSIIDKVDGVQEHLIELTNSITKSNEQLITIGIVLVIVLGIVAILALTILWNQRKIKKMLRDLQEQLEHKEQDETD